MEKFRESQQLDSGSEAKEAPETKADGDEEEKNQKSNKKISQKDNQKITQEKDKEGNQKNCKKIEHP